MSARVLVESEASGRLAELGLTIELIERVVRRADAEASICTALDPPIMEGLTRWGRMNRFLREELIPAAPGPIGGSRDMLTWFMMFHTDEEGFRVELSLPNAITDGRITSWAERIILPVFPRDDDRLTSLVTPDSGDLDEVVVEVTRR